MATQAYSQWSWGEFLVVDSQLQTTLECRKGNTTTDWPGCVQPGLEFVEISNLCLHHQHPRFNGYHKLYKRSQIIHSVIANVYIINSLPWLGTVHVLARNHTVLQLCWYIRVWFLPPLFCMNFIYIVILLQLHFCKIIHSPYQLLVPLSMFAFVCTVVN